MGQKLGGDNILAEKDIVFYKSFSYGFQMVYDFNFHESDSVIRFLKASYPKRAMTHFLASNHYWWILASGEDNEKTRALFKEALEKMISSISKDKKEILYHEELFIKISNFAFKARLELLEYNFIRSVLYLDDCVHYLKKSFGHEGEYPVYSLTSGLYNYFSDYGTRTYPVLYPYFLFAPKGNIKQGIGQLEAASKSTNVFLKTEGQYFLMKIYLETRKEPLKALPYALVLTHRSPENLCYQYMLLKIYLDSDNFPMAKKQLEVLNFQALMNSSLTANQKTYYLKQAQENMKEYYKKK